MAIYMMSEWVLSYMNNNSGFSSEGKSILGDRNRIQVLVVCGFLDHQYHLDRCQFHSSPGSSSPRVHRHPTLCDQSEAFLVGKF